jgi:hypothetical protein
MIRSTSDPQALLVRFGGLPRGMVQLSQPPSNRYIASRGGGRISEPSECHHANCGRDIPARAAAYRLG